MITNAGRSLVCVVDDDFLVRESVEGLLRREGFHVDAFESAESFLARPVQEPPACLIVDLVLPGMSGLELHRELSRRGIEAPMILVTGHGDIRTSVRAMKAGALDFLTKPWIHGVGIPLDSPKNLLGYRIREMIGLPPRKCRAPRIRPKLAVKISGRA